MKKLFLFLVLSLAFTGCSSAAPKEAEKVNTAETSSNKEPDKTSPTITGLDDDYVVELEYEDKFNIKDFIDENLTITDDVDGKLEKYSVRVDLDKQYDNYADKDTLYNAETGEFKDKLNGKHKVTVVKRQIIPAA